MTTTGYCAAAFAIAGLCVLIVATIGAHQTRTQQPTTDLENLMALHDFRRIIDHVHTSRGDTIALAIEIVGGNHDTAAEITVNALGFANPDDTIVLDESQAGEIYDVIGGALRTLAEPDPSTPVSDWGDDLARTLVKHLARDLLTGDDTAIAAGTIATQATIAGLGRAEQIALGVSLAALAASTLATLISQVTSAGADVQLETAGL